MLNLPTLLQDTFLQRLQGENFATFLVTYLVNLTIAAASDYSKQVEIINGDAIRH
jgi:hypothetical protein